MECTSGLLTLLALAKDPNNQGCRALYRVLEIIVDVQEV